MGAKERIAEIDGTLAAYTRGALGNWPNLDADDKAQIKAMQKERAALAA